MGEKRTLSCFCRASCRILLVLLRTLLWNMQRIEQNPLTKTTPLAMLRINNPVGACGNLFPCRSVSYMPKGMMTTARGRPGPAAALVVVTRGWQRVGQGGRKMGWLWNCNSAIPGQSNLQGKVGQFENHSKKKKKKWNREWLIKAAVRNRGSEK